MGDVLLVTGSRSLCDTPAAESWARGVLRERITSAVERVVSGDARGPDEWSQSPFVLWERWYLSGETWRFLADAHYSAQGRRWLPAGTPLPTTRDAWAQRALARNRAMVEHTARVAGARCLALKAPWSRTDGTGHTARLAREHGIAVEVLVCPQEYGPGGVR